MGKRNRYNPNQPNHAKVHRAFTPSLTMGGILGSPMFVSHEVSQVLPALLSVEAFRAMNRRKVKRS